MAKIDVLFKAMLEAGASDLHLVAGQKPGLRVQDEIEQLDSHNVLENFSLRTMLYEITPDDKKEAFEKTGDVGFGHELPGVTRFRANLFQQKYGCAAVFHHVPAKILSVEELGLPTILMRLSMLRDGLILVTGPVRSGKSTTLAAMIDHANRGRKSHIVIIENPIEFVHQSHGCVVSHREVGQHTPSFAAGLRGVLTEDPDVIVIGDVRDSETIRLALKAATGGHLVLGTLHEKNAAMAVDGLIDMFAFEEQEQIRNTLSRTLKAVVAQRLFKRVDVKGRRAALEVMVCTSAISSLIREGKMEQIAAVMQADKKSGSQGLDDAILDLLNKKWISPEEAYEKCNEKTKFASFLKTPPDESA